LDEIRPISGIMRKVISPKRPGVGGGVGRGAELGF